MTQIAPDHASRSHHRWQTMLVAMCIFGCPLWGCVPATNPGGEGFGCISGDCQNGVGILRQPDGKYARVSEGTFKDGKLWTGRVRLALKNMDAILFREVSAGKVVWQRSQGH